MKLTTLPAAACLLFAGMAIGGGLALQDQEHPAPGAPGPVHADMAKRAGKYDSLTEFRMGPGADAIVTRSETQIESVLGGRFLLETGGGEMLGQKFEGLRLWGFNAETETFEAVWTYTMGTPMMVLRGHSNAKTEGVDWMGSWTDRAGEHTMRVEMTFPDDDTHVIDMFEKGADGQEFSIMKTTYTRKKD